MCGIVGAVAERNVVPVLMQPRPAPKGQFTLKEQVSKVADVGEVATMIIV